MIEKRTGKPYINVWFGNFYRPAYDDKEFVKKGVSLLKELGFNSILLDSKAWEDFRDRYEGKEASPYVAMQEYMQEEIERQGLSHVFMSLYLNADNLYPNIRFSPPIYGESVVNPDGSDGKWYRYWSDKAKTSMQEHVSGLLRYYGENNTRIMVNQEEKKPICSMWDPIVAPSFDEDGRKRYLSWLEKNYGDIESLNRAYRVKFSAFDELEPKDYWFSCAYEGDSCYDAADIKADNEKYQMWIDNMKWRKQELVLYFQDMQKRLKSVDKDLYLCPTLTQWSHFLNIDGSKISSVGFSELWDTAMRGIDLYEIAPFVDAAQFISVPVTPLGDPNAYVVSVQHSMMRAMNEGREFLGGIYWGRFLYQHVYEFISPCEIIGSMVGSGINGYSSYGMCGLDDGGVLHRMEKSFLNSLSAANDWAKKVIPLLGQKKKSSVALLFPNAMAAYEPMSVEGNIERRYDLLGFYQACLDFGYEVDVIDINAVEEGRLKDYALLIIPANQSYKKDRREKAEATLKDWVAQGGVLLHGPNDEVVYQSLNIKGEAHEKDEIIYRGGGLVQGDLFETFEGETLLAVYEHSGKGAAVLNSYGKGKVYSLGFYYGSNYSAKIAPHVPLSQKNNELYPLPYMKQDMLRDILNTYVAPNCSIQEKGIEVASFANGLVITNHTSTPISVDEIKGKRYFQYALDENCLLPRSAVFIEC
ncbi:type 1 glutamine amidotransferase family protein [Konateibacter massiliensis]|uniref:hypothetical protein n=1 Tax=Konateibacter massiliensis TaxID=2002841 RepID=UPI000C145CA5|nr:hypothetical protein [Konateibacter massiliensis]